MSSPTPNIPKSFSSDISHLPLKLGLLGFVILIAFLDYQTGYEISFLTFYLFPILLAAWFLGRGYAIFIALVSIVGWRVANIYAGKMYANSFAPIWNGGIRFSLYLIVIWLFSLLKASRDMMEERIRDRTSALANEVAERKFLEKKILTIVEREQERIGQDLHDGLCQHLTGIAIATQILVEKLEAKSLPESDESRRIVTLVEEGISVARNIARGLSPVHAEDRGLMDALHELAENTRDRLKVECVFQCDAPVLLRDDVARMHLYRIAQEAISNAVRHGRARKIVLSLYQNADHIILTIKDNGSGLPQLLPKKGGMGLHIMKHRASMIGAEWNIKNQASGGTLVTCSFKSEAAMEDKVT